MLTGLNQWVEIQTSMSDILPKLMIWPNKLVSISMCQNTFRNLSLCKTKWETIHKPNVKENHLVQLSPSNWNSKRNCWDSNFTRSNGRRKAKTRNIKYSGQTEYYLDWNKIENRLTIVLIPSQFSSLKKLPNKTI